MTNGFLPKTIDRVSVPPIKCQGIKTKLVNFISSNISWHGVGRWIEPFLGSGVVLFNIQPERALLSDTNEHIIRFYQQVQQGNIDECKVREFLEDFGSKLSKQGKDFYYEIRKEFNQDKDSLKFLFLNRSCFNGIIRFNGKGGYNVPFGHKPERFSKAYVTKIVNQVKQIKHIMHDKDWTFQVSSWQDTLNFTNENDFVYLDPPYIGRHTDYFNSWSDDEAIELSQKAKSLPSGFALSMWFENKYRKNDHIDQYWSGLSIKNFSHFYHVGSKETLRNSMEEALVIKPDFDHISQTTEEKIIPMQLSLFK